MVASSASTEPLVATITGSKISRVPVMVATSGSVLADEATIAAFGRLMRTAALVTPNAQELAALGGDSIAATYG